MVSKSHERILKVILQKYKPILRKSSKKVKDFAQVATEPCEDLTEDYSEEVEVKREVEIKKIKVDDAAVERIRREEESSRLLGREYPNLAKKYIDGEITLSQLKQTYYSLSKQIEYTCFDNLKETFGLSKRALERPQWSRKCHSSVSIKEKQEKKQICKRRERPQSASWNINTKPQQVGHCSMITASIYNQPSKSQENSAARRRWNKSVKPDPKILTNEQPRIGLTTKNKEKSKSSISHKERLSAKDLYAYWTESISKHHQRSKPSSSIDLTSRVPRLSQNRLKKSNQVKSLALFRSPS